MARTHNRAEAADRVAEGLRARVSSIAAVVSTWTVGLGGFWVAVCWLLCVCVLVQGKVGGAVHGVGRWVRG